MRSSIPFASVCPLFFWPSGVNSISSDCLRVDEFRTNLFLVFGGVPGDLIGMSLSIYRYLKI